MVLFIENVTLIDGTGAAPLSEAGLLVEGARIVAVGLAADVRRRLPSEGQVAHLDGRGSFLLPGFIDCHVHVMIREWDLNAMLNSPFSLRFYDAVENLRATLHAGITSVRDAGGADLGVKLAVERGTIIGPRLVLSLQMLSQTGGHGDFTTLGGHNLTIFPSYPGMPPGVVDGPDAIRRRVRELLRFGADQIKCCTTGGGLSPTDQPEHAQFSDDELRALVEEAGRHGKRVMAHAQGAAGVKSAIRAGMHSIEHGVWLDDEAIELMLAHGTYLVPTLLAPISVMERANTRGDIPQYAVDKCGRMARDHATSIRRAYEAGVKIAMGTDAGVMAHGLNMREVELMVRIGMSPMDAIVASTATAAACIGLPDVGTLVEGKVADLLLVEGNPLADISLLQDPEYLTVVVKEGELVADRRGVHGVPSRT